MDTQIVIVRAFGGQPLRRVTHAIRNGRVYVSSERAIRLAEDGTLPPVGFPIEDAFVFDGPVFERLSAAWATHSTTTREDWSSLTPLADAIPVIC